jgi:hypothetical protein
MFCNLPLLKFERFFFFQCRTGVVSDCFKFRGTRHARHTQLLSPRLCTTKTFTMTQLKLFTWAYWLAWLTCCRRLALNSSMELAPTVVSGRWFHSRTVLWKKESHNRTSPGKTYVDLWFCCHRI